MEKNGDFQTPRHYFSLIYVVGDTFQCLASVYICKDQIILHMLFYLQLSQIMLEILVQSQTLRVRDFFVPFSLCVLLECVICL